MSNTYISNRLIINTLSPNDKEFIFALVNSNGWLKFIGDRKVYSLEDAEKFIQKILGDAKRAYWTVRLKENLLPIGVITLIQRDFLEYPDLGFAFLPEYQGKGYAFEASAIVLNDLKLNLQYPEIQAITLPYNRKSIQLLHKLGFAFKKEMEDNGEILSLFSLLTNP